MDKSGSKIPGQKVLPGQIWQVGDRHVLTTKVDRGWVIVINSFGTTESYCIGKQGRDQYFHDFKFLKNYDKISDFPYIFPQ